jgi:hypothetical protein
MTCLEVGGETADPRIDSFSIHLAQKFGQLKAHIEGALRPCEEDALKNPKKGM